ncbi:uncharacterized protein [Halyomorpha halys]|nr:uncharacterized protein LOC106687726 isoform X2 [Halyomorpha halys]
MAGWLVVTLALVGPIAGQEEYQAAPQGGGEAAAPPPPPPPQVNFQPQFGSFGGNHEAFLASFQAQQLFADHNLHQGGPPVQDVQHQFPVHGSGRSAFGGGDQQLVTKVFVKPDGGITTIQVPQNVNFR